MNKKALVLDIDGTLTNSKKEITNATKQAIWDTMEAGNKVILASGRPTPGMFRYEKELELAKRGGYLLSFNGARIVDCRSGEIIYQKQLPLTMLPSLYRFAKENGCGLITYLGHEVISAFPADEYVQIEARINGLPIREVDNFLEFVDFDINKCLMTAPAQKAEVFEKELQEKYGHMASIYRSEPYFIEIMPQNTDKAASLEKILPIINVSKEDTVCCGDGFNDISMIQFAGVGVAMANAQQKVKDAADYITGSNDEDGLVEVIQKFLS